MDGRKSEGARIHLHEPFTADCSIWCAQCTMHLALCTFCYLQHLKICLCRVTITVCYRKRISFARLVSSMSSLSHLNLFMCQNGKYAVNQTTRNENSLVKCKMRGPEISATAGQFSFRIELVHRSQHNIQNTFGCTFRGDVAFIKRSLFRVECTKFTVCKRKKWKELRYFVVNILIRILFIFFSCWCHTFILSV